MNKILKYSFIVLTLTTLSDTIAKPKVVLSMIMRNEAGRKLRECIEEANRYVDLAVIIDDDSTDESVKICQEILGDKLILIHNDRSKFSNEISLRKQQWEETIKTNPDWILNIDADQIFEIKMRDEIYKHIYQDKVDVFYFRLYDFWNETQYRDDAYWCGHKSYTPFLMRYRKDFVPRWRETPQHCGRFPANCTELSKCASPMRIKHYGWARLEDRVSKYYRYMQLDPGGKYGWQAQYDSILDSNPHLVDWIE
jgi:glycosyltransferase involved in cell wall biosynthesis